MTEPIIAPVDKKILSAELDTTKLIRHFKGLEVYIITAEDSPNVMDEIGRIREVEFRKEGGGTSKAKDIDRYDIGETPYKQLVAWDPEEQEIVAMYRYILCREAIRSPDDIELATYRLFTFSDRFVNEFLPYTIELGRSVVNRSAKKSLFGLFVIWSGLAALVKEYRDIKYFFGKTTLYGTFNIKARDILLYFLELYFAESKGLVKPRDDLDYKKETDGSELKSFFRGGAYKRDYAVLLETLSSLGESIPPIIISYLKLTKTIRCFGTAWNPHFGQVMETALLLTIRDIGRMYKRKFIDTYTSINTQAFA
jgi:hypothetical protein